MSRDKHIGTSRRGHENKATPVQCDKKKPDKFELRKWCFRMTTGEMPDGHKDSDDAVLHRGRKLPED